MNWVFELVRVATQFKGKWICHTYLSKGVDVKRFEIESEHFIILKKVVRQSSVELGVEGALLPGFHFLIQKLDSVVYHLFNLT